MTGVRIGTAERDSTFLSQGHALKSVLDRHPALAPVEVSTLGHASVENANRLAANDIDFGFMASNWIGRAKNGEAPFAQKVDLRMVAPMNAGPLFFIARGEADAQLQCPIPNKVMTALAARILLRVLPYAPADLDTVLRAVPFYRRTVMRKGAIRGLDADVAQAAVVNVLVTHARVAEDKVKDVTAAIFAARDELPRLNALFDGIGDLFTPLRSEGAGALEFGGVM